MAFRKKIYYPDTQIRKNQFTSGKEWMTLNDWEEYIGYYHIYDSTREVFTEPEWHPNKSRVLVRYEERHSSYLKYNDIVNYTTVRGQKTEKIGPIQYRRFSAPVAVVRQLTSAEEQSGLMTRYFVFKRNERENKYPIEIDEKQANKFENTREGINQFLYELVQIPWKIDGPEFDVIQNGVLKVPGVFNTNRRILDRFSKKFPILRKVLTNFREFSIYNT